MMGIQAAAARFFYDFCLDDHVPKDHQLRGIDRHLELDGVRAALKPFYSSTGRPSVDPELMIRMRAARRVNISQRSMTPRSARLRP